MEEAKNIAFRYFEGISTPAEEAVLYGFVTTPQGSALFHQWEDEWNASSKETLKANAAWSRFMADTTMDENEEEPAHTPHLYKYVAAAAAVVVLVAGIGFLAWKAFAPRPEQMFALTAPTGSTTQVTMPDGTKVWLNAGSSLSYSNQYGEESRNVNLVGEAYFEVAKQNGKTFTVSTEGYDVVVKGTHFDVSAYDDDPDVTTTLLEGRVVIRKGSKEISMAPGDAVTLDKNTGKLTKQRASGDAHAWTSDLADYGSLTLAQLAKKLSRQYDVNISIEGDKLANTKISMTLNSEMTIDEVLQALKSVTGAQVTRSGKNVTMK